MIGQREPVRFLRSASRLVRNDGILALHEMDMSRDIRSSPPLAMLRVVNQTIHAAVERSGVLLDAGGRLVDLFDEAELPNPQLFSESVVATGEDRSVFRLITAVLSSLIPHLTAVGDCGDRHRDIGTTLASRCADVAQPSRVHSTGVRMDAAVNRESLTWGAYPIRRR